MYKSNFGFVTERKSLYIAAILLLVNGLFCFNKVALSETKIEAEKINPSFAEEVKNKKLVYIVSDARIPFWNTMSRGIKSSAESLGYRLEMMSSENSPRHELEFTAKALKDKVAGIIISPTTSSACVTVLKFAKKAGIPVVISDIGTDGGEYVSYISSNNRSGAYKIGKVLAKKMNKLGLQKGSVGIIAIPQKRLNGQERTAGFMQAMDEEHIKGAGLKQQSTFSDEETYNLSLQMIRENPDVRAIWLQGSNRYQAALRAINDTNNKNKILLVTFDAEPEFLELIPKGVLVGSAMQQPWLMGQKAVQTMDRYLHGVEVKKNLQLPILAVSSENIAEKLADIKRNVLGIDDR